MPVILVARVFHSLITLGHGIGRECALGFAAEGVKGLLLGDPLYDSALDAAQETETVATNPAFAAVAMQVDVANPSSVAAMVSTLLKVFGQVDYYVHSTESDHCRSWQDTAKGQLHCTHAVAEIMRRQAIQTFKIRGRAREAGRGAIITVGEPSSVAKVTPEEEVLGLIRKIGACRLRT